MAPSPHLTTIDVTVRGSVAFVRFDRPEHRNGVTPQMATEMYDALDWISGEVSVDVVVPTVTAASSCLTRPPTTPRASCMRCRR